jgi:CheY-like chemotaxis protein
VAEDTEDVMTAPKGAGQLLAIVDDEEIVRTFSHMALEKMGYRVRSFGNPKECLEAIRSEPDQFALLLTDQTMPVMKGVELTSQLRQFAPQLPVVIMSGYFSRISPDTLARLGHVSLLSKLNLEPMGDQ